MLRWFQQKRMSVQRPFPQSTSLREKLPPFTEVTGLTMPKALVFRDHSSSRSGWPKVLPTVILIRETAFNPSLCSCKIPFTLYPLTMYYSGPDSISKSMGGELNQKIMLSEHGRHFKNICKTQARCGGAGLQLQPLGRGTGGGATGGGRAKDQDFMTELGI